MGLQRKEVGMFKHMPTRVKTEQEMVVSQRRNFLFVDATERENIVGLRSPR